MNIKTLLFDADGTLIDYNLAEKHAFKETLAATGYTGDSEKALFLYRKINKAHWEAFERGEINQVQLRTQRFAGLIDELVLKISPPDMSEIYLKELSRCGQLIPNALEVLGKLHESGDYNLVIVTNGLKDVQYDRLKAGGIHDFFNEIIISEEIGSQKPEREFFEKTFSILGNNNNEEYLIIGDSLSSDMMGGIGSGIKTCWFNPEQSPGNENIIPDYEISDLNELFPLLKNIEVETE